MKKLLVLLTLTIGLSAWASDDALIQEVEIPHGAKSFLFSREFTMRLDTFTHLEGLKGQPRVTRVGVRASSVGRPTPCDYEVYAVISDGVDDLGEIAALMSRTPSRTGTPGVMDPSFHRAQTRIDR